MCRALTRSGSPRCSFQVMYSERRPHSQVRRNRDWSHADGTSSSRMKAAMLLESQTASQAGRAPQARHCQPYLAIDPSAGRVPERDRATTARSRSGYFFLFRACVNALPAADFDAFEVRPSRSTCDALVAAAAEVCFFGALVCASALPAADLELAPVDLPDSVLGALLAADFDVTSFFATGISLCAECAGSRSRG